MEATKYLLYSEVYEALRKGDENKLKKAMNEINALKPDQLTEVEALNLATVKLVSQNDQAAVQQVASSQGLSLSKILPKVSNNHIKRKLASTPCYMPWQ